MYCSSERAATAAHVLIVIPLSSTLESMVELSRGLSSGDRAERVELVFDGRGRTRQG